MAFAPPSDWLVPQWPAPEHVRAVCTTRAGGVSQGPFESFNLGAYVGDDPDHVQENRHRLEQAIGARPVYMRQVHGSDVLMLDAQTQNELEADASLTAATGLACAVMAADCLPVLLTSVQGSLVAAAHAGWRGLAGVNGLSVLDATVMALRSALPADDQAIIAWLGPCIGPGQFEVGDEVRGAFVDAGLDPDRTFVPGAAPGKWMADLAGLARQTLLRAGVQQVYGNDSSPAWCTATQASRFFSHRRDTVRLGGSGRMAAFVWRNR